MKPFPLFHEDKPALFLAPLAGLTHSPFRRLLSEFGGYSALYSEMLNGHALFSENFETSTFIHRREEEGKVVYQLQLNNDFDVEKIVNQLVKQCDPWAIDINLGCPAPTARKKRTGARLFLEHDEVKSLLTRVKSVWDGPLSVKSRLGSRGLKNWEEHYFKMIDMFDEVGIDWYTIHPRFMEDAFRRNPQRSIFPKITERTDIPVIANGEIKSQSQTEHELFDTLSGVMIGRAAIAQPWIFKEISDPTFNKDDLDFQEIWNRLFEYVCEEFIPTRAIGRMKQFTTYYGQNFRYGHTMYSSMINADSLDAVYSACNRFLEKRPEQVKELRILQF